MREIKFRAWLNMQEEMIYADVFGVGEKFAGRDCEIMQFTGLLDRNGKEIYEGDILKNPFGKVSYLGGGFFLCTLDNISIALINKDTISSNNQVIGNIYENPELIKNNE